MEDANLESLEAAISGEEVAVQAARSIGKRTRSELPSDLEIVASSSSATKKPRKGTTSSTATTTKPRSFVPDMLLVRKVMPKTPNKVSSLIASPDLREAQARARAIESSDSGSIKFNFISRSTANKLLVRGIIPENTCIKVRLANNCIEHINVFFNLEINLNEVIIKDKFLVLENLPIDMVIGRKAIIKHDLFKFIKNKPLVEEYVFYVNEEEEDFKEAFPIERIEKAVASHAQELLISSNWAGIGDLILKFKSIFSQELVGDPARIKPMDLKLVQDFKDFPKSMKLPTRIQCREHSEEIERQLEKLIRAGIISRDDGEFYSQIILIKKKRWFSSFLYRL